MFSFKTLGTNSAPLKLQGLKAFNKKTLGTNSVVLPKFFIWFANGFTFERSWEIARILNRHWIDVSNISPNWFLFLLILLYFSY